KERSFWAAPKRPTKCVFPAGGKNNSEPYFTLVLAQKTAIQAEPHWMARHVYLKLH
uniref:Uncharacterized protein n=1 Tax=Aegilops tauschii subsp. strangulata TaxID=200361 RepID=A0A453GVN6_AEGTS